MSDRAKRIILLILVILPFFFPYVSGRGNWQVPSCLNEDGSIFFLLFLVYTFCFPFYWVIVGYCFFHFGVSFQRSFFLGNIPVFFNLFGQLIYYGIFSMEGGTYPWLEYLLSSHLDKFDIFLVFTDSLSITAILSALGIFAFFSMGYFFNKRI